jgi:hypothetical protein
MKILVDIFFFPEKPFIKRVPFKWNCSHQGSICRQHQANDSAVATPVMYSNTIAKLNTTQRGQIGPQMQVEDLDNYYVEKM